MLSQANGPEAKRTKAPKQHLHLDKNNAEDEGKGSKRKWENDTCMNNEIEAIVPKENQNDLKRKRDHEPEITINLGKSIHKCLKPNFLGPTLKKRFMGSSPKG